MYEGADGKDILSLIAPGEWGRSQNSMKYLATVKLLADHTWEVIEKSHSPLTRKPPPSPQRGKNARNRTRSKLQFHHSFFKTLVKFLKETISNYNAQPVLGYVPPLGG